VLLFDEPLSNLDAKLRGELRRELKQLHERLGATMVYVTHDQVEAMTLASRIAVMKAGRIQQIDTPANVYARPVNLFVAGFLGAPSMNFIEGRLERTGDRTWFTSAPLCLDVSAYPFMQPVQHGMPSVLGVRPEHIALLATAQETPAAARAAISLVEPMGANQVVWLDVEGVSLAVDADAQFEPPADRRVAFEIDPRRVSFFDLQSQQRL
jgi:multiple sugar transport system ATP-binding protein